MAGASAPAFFVALAVALPPNGGMKPAPDLVFETAALARGFTRIAGVDEVGRGPLAGPVTAAAVVLDLNCIPVGLNDSKVLTAAQRNALAAAILASADCAVAHASVEEIDSINILQASHLAMRRALAALALPADHALIDGNRMPRDMTLSGECIVRGDAYSLSIAAASIIAKVARDALMVDLAQQHPGYGWHKNAGYPTPDHLAALKNLGVTPYHRRSFRPVHNILYQDVSLTP